MGSRPLLLCQRFFLDSLVDLGSSNGTFLNKRRVHQPFRLHDQDKIFIGGRQFIFREPEEISPDYQTTIAERTIQEIENVPCWLVVAAEEFHRA